MFTNTLSKNAQHALAILGENKILPDKTYLAGGSALALHYGHRISVDFYFFTPSTFVGKQIKKELEKKASLSFKKQMKKILYWVFLITLNLVFFGMIIL